jgi:hypothetical protein
MTAATTPMTVHLIQRFDDVGDAASGGESSLSVTAEILAAAAVGRGREVVNF